MDITEDTRVTRDEAAEHLRKAGFVVSPKTLANLATQGKGPAYQLFGRRTLYRWGDLIGWAEGRLTAPRRSASEHSLQVAA